MYPIPAPAAVNAVIPSARGVTEPSKARKVGTSPPNESFT